MYLRALGEGSAFASIVRAEREADQQWKHELARITGRPVPTSQVSLDDYVRDHAGA